MSETLYSIKESTLTDIGDALRRKHGETEVVTYDEPLQVGDVVVSKTSNTNADGTFKEWTMGKEKYVITVPGAEFIDVKVIAINFLSGNQSLTIASGAYPTGSLPIGSTILAMGVDEREFRFEGNAITFLFDGNYEYGRSGYYAECIGYMSTEEVKRTYSSDEVAQAIDDIEVGDVLPEEAFVLSGNAQYRFYYGAWDWFIEQYGDKIKTENLNDTQYMFYGTQLEFIPFELNYNTITTSKVLNYMFCNSSYLRTIPKFNNCKVDSMNNIFDGCSRLRTLPEDITEWFDWSYVESRTTTYACSRGNMFQNCYSLRSVPIEFLTHVNPFSVYSYTYFSGGFYSCYSLDELIELPIPYKTTFTSNAFPNAFHSCSRLKNLTFAMPDGQPYVMQWKSQLIDLATYVGYTSTTGNILNYNSGITADKVVRDDATYQALKDDPDWFTQSPGWSRYNKESAIATINSLPDTSAYLASAGGTNTIKFKGASGSKTDGGAINTLSEAEIAVATAKGWTVSLV